MVPLFLSPCGYASGTIQSLSWLAHHLPLIQDKASFVEKEKKQKKEPAQKEGWWRQERRPCPPGTLSVHSSTHVCTPYACMQFVLFLFLPCRLRRSLPDKWLTCVYIHHSSMYACRDSRWIRGMSIELFLRCVALRMNSVHNSMSLLRKAPRPHRDRIWFHPTPSPATFRTPRPSIDLSFQLRGNFPFK